jgi:sugar phosphate isomerase/epimerase
MNIKNTARGRIVTDRIQVHIPYRMLCKRLEEVVSAGLNPEIFLDGITLDHVTSGELREVSEVFHANGRTITVHGPYMDLSPGGADEKVRLATVDRYRQTFEAAKELRPRAVVLHGGYDERRFDGDVSLWLGQSLKTWPEFIKEAERLNTVIAVENIFDDGPAPLKALVESLSSPNFRICLDAGHLKLFSEASMEEWFSEIGGFIAEVHIHDNRGKIDDHLPLGDGIIDFQLFFRLLKNHTRDPIYTIELHGEEVLWRGVKALRKYL